MYVSFLVPYKKEGAIEVDDLKERQQHIVEWIKEAAESIRTAMENELVIEEKTNPSDLVTNVDKQIEQLLVERIREHYPNEFIVSEEGYGDSLNSLEGVVWFIDPIDGTTNFITQKEDFAIMIAVYQDGVGHLGYVYDVIKDHLYCGIRNKGAFLNDVKIPQIKDCALSEGLFSSSSHLMTKEKFKYIREAADVSLGVRMIGSAGLEICHISMEKSVVYMALTLSPWDIAPGLVIAREVGLICTNFEGHPFQLLSDEPSIFATPTVHRQMMDTLKKNK